MVDTSAVMRFGNCLFRVASDRKEDLQLIESMFARAGSVESIQADQPTQPIWTEQLDDQKSLALDPDQTAEELLSMQVANLLNRLYAHHADCIWLDAAAVCTPEGRPVILVGPSFAGKTTTALAMGVGRGWKVLSEDIALFDPALLKILPCPSPSRIRAGTIDQISKISQLPDQSFKRPGWFFDQNIFCDKPVSTPFFAALSLDAIDVDKPPEKFSARQISAEEYLRRILPYSNLLKWGTQLNLFYKALNGARCLQVSGGDIEDRISLLESLVCGVNQ